MFVEASLLLNEYITFGYVVKIKSAAILVTVCNTAIRISSS